MDIFEYNVEDIKKDLFLYYKCDSNSNQNDYSGNNNTGTLVNNISFDGADGKVKGCFNFGFNMGRIDSTNDFSAVYNQNIWSMSAWVKALSSAGTSYRCVFRSSSNGMGLYIRNNIYQGFDNANVLFNEAVPLLGEWQHIVSTYNNPNWKIYINGELKQTLTKSRASNLTIPRFGSDGSNHGDQRMDEIMFWGRELNADEIERLYLYYNRINKKFT